MRWYGTLEIGATENSPAQLNFPVNMTDCRQKTTFMWTGNKIQNNGEDMTTVSKDLTDLRVGIGNYPCVVNGALQLLRKDVPSMITCNHALSSEGGRREGKGREGKGAKC